MDKKLYIKEDLYDLSLVTGDIMFYNEQTEMFEMDKRFSKSEGEFSTYSLIRKVKIDYATAIDLVVDNKAELFETKTEEAKDKEELDFFKSSYALLEKDPERFNRALDRILEKINN